MMEGEEGVMSPGVATDGSMRPCTCFLLAFEKPELANRLLFFPRLLIRDGNGADAAALYDSYEVEYLPNEGLLSSSHFLFIELTSDASGTSTGFAVRYQGGRGFDSSSHDRGFLPGFKFAPRIRC